MWRVTRNGLLARKLRLALTALAIVIGVTFVTGTLVLGDTLNRTFDNLVGTVYAHVSFEIRGQVTLKGTGNSGPDSTSDRRPIPASIVARVRRIPGVAFAYGSVEGYAQFVDHSGNAIGNGSSAGFSFDPNRQLSALRLVSGHAPSTAADVVMDRATARKHHFALGERVRMLLPGTPRTFTITGIVTFGSDDNLAGASLAGFALPVAQQLFNLRGRYDTINVLAAQGADNVALEQRIAKVLPAGVQVVSGQQVANELYQTIHDDLSFLSTALLIFALISLFVGGFTIFNTFSITVGQRTRELALLRLVGASRRQVFGSVLVEAALTGLLASLIGLGLGVLAALGLKALLGAFGLTLPAAPLVFKLRTVVVAILVGVGVTLISAVLPARRAVRIAPVAALVDAGSEDGGGPRRRRLATGMTAGGAGTALVILGVAKPSIGLVGVGALAVFIAILMLVPAIARPLASALGRPLGRLLGTPGRLARRNATRNPLRTAQTAAALMIGVALVSTIAVLGASLGSSATHEVDSAVRADYIIGGSDSVSTSIAPIILKLKGVEAATGVLTGKFDVGDSLQSLGAVSTPGLDRTVNLHVRSGRGVEALSAGELLVDSITASKHHLRVGSELRVTFAQTGPATLRVGGIFAPNPLVGSYLVSARYFLAHFNTTLLDAVLISTTPGTVGFERTLNRALAAYPNLSIQSRAQFEQSEQKNVNDLLDLIYVLLALAVLIALIGIVNTLMLTVFERTHEIGLMRAVGMKRRQVRTMIRAESVIVAMFGAVIGIVTGTLLGLALASSLRDNNVTVISVPVGSLIVFLILSVLLGLGAASWPARRAANLDVLSAISVE